MLLALGTMVLGAVLAVVKGRDYGLGYFVGNLSTPYLLAAFFAGRAVRSRAGAAVVGFLMTWMTLAAFYITAEAVFGYPSGSMTRFYAEWFLAGAMSGTALGLLGRKSRERVRLQYVLPLALVLEPFAVVAVQATGRFSGRNPRALQLAASSGEIVLGCIALGVVRLRSRPSPAREIEQQRSNQQGSETLARRLGAFELSSYVRGRRGPRQARHAEGVALLTRRWPGVLVAAAALAAGGACCWQLPWRAEAVVVGQFWTPHAALALLALGSTGFAVVAVSRVVTLHGRWRDCVWAFEGAALVTTAVTVAWLFSLVVLGFGLIAADGRFAEMRAGDRVLVVRTTTTPTAVERTTGERQGLLVRWGVPRGATRP